MGLCNHDTEDRYATQREVAKLPRLHDHKEIQRRGQQYCNVDMANHHWAGNDHGYGWESHKSLITYKPTTLL